MIESGWGDLDKTYLVVVLRDSWETSDLSREVKDIYATFHDYAHKPVSIVVDLRYSRTPTGSVMSVITWAVKNLPPNANRIVIVSRTTIWKRIYQAIMHKRSGKAIDMQFVTTIDEAYQLIITAPSSS